MPRTYIGGLFKHTKRLFARCALWGTIFFSGTLLLPERSLEHAIVSRLKPFGGARLRFSHSELKPEWKGNDEGLGVYSHGVDCGWYRDYVRLHKETVARLRKGLKDVKVLVFDCEEASLCGGLGDRLGGFASLFYVSIVLDRALIIHHTKPLPLDVTLVPHDDIDWNVASLLGSDMPSISLNLIDMPELKYIDAMFQPEHSDVPVMRVTINRYFAGLAVWSPKPCLARWYFGAMHRIHAETCQNVKLTTNSDTFALAFNSLFQPSHRVAERVTHMRQSLGLDGGSEVDYIALHARVGGNAEPSQFVAGWEDPSRDSLDDKRKFIECASTRAIKSAALDPERTPFVILSDSQDFKMAISMADSRVRYLRDTTLFHIDRSTGDDDMTMRGNIDTLADFFLLSKASCIVASYSAFSGAASSLLQARRGTGCYFPMQDCDKDGIDFWYATERPFNTSEGCEVDRLDVLIRNDSRIHRIR